MQGKLVIVLGGIGGGPGPGGIYGFAISRGFHAFLVATQNADGSWTETETTGTGFPRVFYLRYHGYPKFFPLWALARYRNLRCANSRRVACGM